MERDLLRMIDEINKTRSLLEEECDMLNELLRPWPQHKTNGTNSEAQNTSSSSSKKEPERREDDLSKEEQEALLTVEKLLQKAQITRQVKTKAEKKSCSSTQGDNFAVLRQSAQGHSEEIDGRHGAKSVSLESPPPSGRSLSKGNSNCNRTCSETQRNSRRGVTTKGIMGAAGAQSSQGLDRNTFTRNRSVESLSQAQHPKSSRGRMSRPTSGKTQHVPVHMSAPFKTENVKMPTRRTNHAQSLSRHSSSRARPDSGLSQRSYKALPAIKHYNSGEHCGADSSKIEDMVKQNGEDAILSVTEDTKTSGDSNLDAAEGPSFSPQLEQRLPSQPGGSGKPMTKMSSLSEPDEAPMESVLQLFTLRRNGSELKIPGKLAKLVSLNKSLREQCSAATLTRRVSPSDSGQQFVERLQGNWTISEELWTRVRAITCVRAHRQLLDMLQGLDLPHLSAQSSYGMLYRAKRTLEFVLSMFASLQEESDYLSQVQFRKEDSPMVENRTDYVTDIPNVAFSDFHQGHENQDVEQCLRSNKEWTELKFTENYLKVQLWLSDLVKSEWWHTLQENTSDPCVLQSLYSLLSSGGQFLPAFVANQNL
ncbi:hypothetical protein EGW08_017257 [Elysia chlorotica]|uniref:Uncharacterized protein n=1 Tax=Elysia chlorotica TaxID=188477 RepID=A0A3S1B364_ELYCH|nr:hypothetical protein EGW08_017257 [Elysia chlorotica]